MHKLLTKLDLHGINFRNAPTIFDWLSHLRRNEVGQTFLMFKFSAWKRKAIERLLDPSGNASFVYISLAVSVERVARIADRNPAAISVIWGAGGSRELVDLLKGKGIPIWRMEDGFIRSVGLGTRHVLPSSAIIDKTGGIYFDSTRCSSLENYYNQHSFTEDEVKRAGICIGEITRNFLTKYNLEEDERLDSLSAQHANILVFGQCEDDASIKFGSPAIQLNSDLIALAIEENPNARIFYRPHPDVIAGKRKRYSDPAQFGSKVSILDGKFSVWKDIDLFEKIYVMSSLAGFEAILRGKSVRVAGLPFYAGWGISEDLVTCKRRQRRLTVEEVFYGAYIEAATYFDPKTGQKTSLEKIISEFVDSSKRSKKRRETKLMQRH